MTNQNVINHHPNGPSATAALAAGATIIQIGIPYHDFVAVFSSNRFSTQLDQLYEQHKANQ